MHWQRFLPRHNPAYLMVALIVAWGLTFTYAGERIPVGDGIGFDGVSYANITMHLWEVNDKVSSYAGRRLLPSVVIRYALEVFRLPVDLPHILHAWLLSNVVLFAFILLVLLAICDELDIGKRGKWLVFLGFFGNFFHMKMSYFRPVGTDVWSVAFCVLALLAYFRQQRSLVALWTFLGSFTWGIFPIFGGALILFPFVKRCSQSMAAGPRCINRRFAQWAAASITMAVLVYTSYLFWGQRFSFWPTEEPRSSWIMAAGLACSSLYLYLALKELLNGAGHPSWSELASWDFIGRLTAFAVTIGLIYLCHKGLDPMFTGVSGTGTTDYHAPFPGRIGAMCKSLLASLHFANITMGLSTDKPFIFTLMEIGYYGPVIILIMLAWVPICRQAHAYGTGVVLALVAGVFLSLSSEPRYCMLFFPLALVLLAKVLQEVPLRLGIFAGACLLLCKAWLPLHASPWPPIEVENRYSFPLQIYFMNTGAWVSVAGYLIQAAFALTGSMIVKLALMPRSSANERHQEIRAAA